MDKIHHVPKYKIEEHVVYNIPVQSENLVLEIPTHTPALLTEKYKK
jgi:hypothetical protein